MKQSPGTNHVLRVPGNNENYRKNNKRTRTKTEGVFSERCE